MDADAIAVVIARDARLSHADRRSSAGHVDHRLATLADDVSDARVAERFEQLAIKGEASFQ